MAFACRLLSIISWRSRAKVSSSLSISVVTYTGQQFATAAISASEEFDEHDGKILNEKYIIEWKRPKYSNIVPKNHRRAVRILNPARI